MVHDSRAIVLNSLRYSDSAYVVRTFTEVAGARSFLVQVGKGRTAQAKVALLQPLTLVHVAWRADRAGLARPVSFQRSETLLNIPFDTIRSCIALFMAELTGRAVQEEHGDEALFRYIWAEVHALDNATGPLALFPHRFLLGLSEVLGFGPSSRSEGNIFDLMEGQFSNRFPPHVHHLSGEPAALLRQIIDGTGPLHLPDEEVRSELLNSLIDHCRIHLQGMRDVHSHLVLREVLR
jgi:DNA repair protein RecO (recombination protein O)